MGRSPCRTRPPHPAGWMCPLDSKSTCPAVGETARSPTIQNKQRSDRTPSDRILFSFQPVRAKDFHALYVALSEHIADANFGEITLILQCVSGNDARCWVTLSPDSRACEAKTTLEASLQPISLSLLVSPVVYQVRWPVGRQAFHHTTSRLRRSAQTIFSGRVQWRV